MAEPTARPTDKPIPVPRGMPKAMLPMAMPNTRPNAMPKIIPNDMPLIILESASSEAMPAHHTKKPTGRVNLLRKRNEGKSASVMRR